RRVLSRVPRIRGDTNRPRELRGVAAGSMGVMRAISVSQTGGPDVLQIAEVPGLAPGPGQLLVTVAAAGVNFMDIYQREGRPPYGRDLPFVPGAEGAGMVAALGPGTEGFAVGDRVAWAGAPGCYAEQAVIPATSAIS